MLDFIVRNQDLFFLILAGFVGLPFLFAAVSQLAGVLSVGFQANPGITAVLPEPEQAESAKRSLKAASLGVLGFAIIAALLFVAREKPIPSTIALELPRIIQTAPNNQALIVFVHGWNGDGTDTWRAFPNLVRNDPKFKTHDLLVIDYPTYVFRRELNITDLSDFIGTSLEEDLDIYNRYVKITVIAHSMGGLIARKAVIHHSLGRKPGGVTQLIEIGTPHDGANPSRLAAALGIDDVLVNDMNRRSRFLSELRTNWRKMADKPPSFCIGSPQDLVVPRESAEADCTETLTYPQWSHTDMVKPVSHVDYRYVTPMRRVQ